MQTFIRAYATDIAAPVYVPALNELGALIGDADQHLAHLAIQLAISFVGSYDCPPERETIVGTGPARPRKFMVGENDYH